MPPLYKIPGRFQHASLCRHEFKNLLGGIPVKTDFLGWDISHSPKFSVYGGKRFNHSYTPERHEGVRETHLSRKEIH